MAELHSQLTRHFGKACSEQVAVAGFVIGQAQATGDLVLDAGKSGFGTSDAVAIEQFNPDLRWNLGRVQMAAGKRREAYERDPGGFSTQWHSKDMALRGKVVRARKLVREVELSDEVLELEEVMRPDVREFLVPKKDTAKKGKKRVKNRKA